MTPGSKILTGAVVTAALAAIVHGPMGNGKSFVEYLETSANAAVSGTQGVTAAADHDSAFRRGVTLSGPVTDPAKREELLAQARAIPGMAFANWAKDDAAAPAKSDEAPATAEQIKDCQMDVDAAIKGKTIQFQSGTATLSPDSTGLIDELTKAISACAGTKVEVAGHTDLTGDDVANQRLSEERANSVVSAMTGKGVPADRLLPKGYGETKPVEPGMSSTANAKNRRIEFQVAAAQ